jgi:hypothetical protein
MANSTGSADDTAEPALIYDAGERRTHAEHAAEAYDLAARADGLRQMGKITIAELVERRSQWHATMALYEVTRLLPRAL